MGGFMGPVAQKLVNLEKAEDAAHTTADKGIMALAVRKDTAAALAGTDGDYIPLIVDASGQAWVNVGAILGVSSKGQATMANSLPVTFASNQAGLAQLPAALGQAASAASTSVVIANDQDFVKAEDAGHTTGDKGIPSLSVRQDTAAALAGTDADYQPLITDASGRVHANVGSIIGVTAAGQAEMAASIPVTIANNQDFVKAEDAGHSTGDKGIPALAVRKDTAAALAGTDADYTPLISDASGRLHANVGDLVGITGKGQAAMANSLSVAIASDNVVTIKEQVSLTYGVVDGANGTGNVDGVTTSWYAVRGTEGVATDELTTTANAGKYFDADNVAFDDNPIWIYIPMNASGYTTFFATITNSLGINLVVTLYAVAKNALWTNITAIGNGKSVSDAILYYQIATETLATGSTGIYGPGGAFPNECNWPIGFLLIKADPASDPGAGTSWRLGVMRNGPAAASIPA